MKKGTPKTIDGYHTCRVCKVSKPHREYDRYKNGRCSDTCRVCAAMPRRKKRSFTPKPRAMCGIYMPEKGETKPYCMFFPRCRSMLETAAKMARDERRPTIGSDGVELPCFPSSVHHGEFLEYYAPDEGETAAPPEVVRVGSVITVTDSLRQMIISGD